MAPASPPLVLLVGRSLDQLKKLLYLIVIVCLHDRESKMEDKGQITNKEREGGKIKYTKR